MIARKHAMMNGDERPSTQLAFAQGSGLSGVAYGAAEPICSGAVPETSDKSEKDYVPFRLGVRASAVWHTQEAAPYRNRCVIALGRREFEYQFLWTGDPLILP